MSSFGAIAELAFDTLKTSDQDIIQSPFNALIATPSDKAIFLIEAQPYDKDQSTESIGELFKRYSDVGYTSKETDSPSSVHYEAKLRRSPTFSQSLSREGAIGGRIVPNFGEIVLQNESGDLDELIDFAWDARTVIVKMGKETFALAEFGTVINATALRAVGTLSDVTIKLRSLDFKLRTPIQINKYGGTGGSDGGANLEGKPKPLAFGVCLNVECVLVNSATLLYQVHDGQIESVDAVYDNGAALSFVSSGPSAGEYTTDLTAGTITLGGSAVGLITADIKGDDLGGSYVNTTGTIVRRIVSNYGKRPLTDPTDLDTDSFSSFETDQPAVVGIFIGTEDELIEDVVVKLMTGVGSFAGFNRNGKYRVLQFKAPSGSVDLRLTDSNMLSLQRAELAPPFDFPISKIQVAYERNFRVQSPDTVAGSVTDARRAFLKEERRLVESTDASIEVTHILAEEPEPVESYFSLEADASTEASRLLTLYKADRQFLRVEALRSPFTLDLHDLVRVTSSRFGLSAGKEFRITAIVDNDPTDRVTLELWG